MRARGAEELLAAVVILAAAVGAVLSAHGTDGRLLGIVLVTAVIPAALIDLRTRKIPNRLTGPAAATALLVGLLTHPAGVPAQLLWALIAGGFFFIFAVLYPAGLGMGDVKLAALIGLCLKSSAAVAVLCGILLAAGVGIVIIARSGVTSGRKTAIPLGPFLAAGGLVGLYAGPHLIHWYLHTAH